MADVDTVPSNPEELLKLFEEASGNEPPVAEAPAPDDTPEPKSETPAPEPVEAEREPDGIATKDGKHVIPYSVLKSERDRASRAEQIAREAHERLAALEAQMQAQAQSADNRQPHAPAAVPAGESLSAEDLETLKEDFPTVYKAVMASMAAAQAIEARLNPVVETVRSAQMERARTDAERVQEAIDAVPKLAHMQANDPAAFALAQQFDSALRAQPAWADKPMEVRFAQVAAMVEAATGSAIDVSPQPVTKTGDLKQAAKARAAESSHRDVPTSLSEFPAGSHAAQDEREALDAMTPLQIAEKFSRMSPDQLDAYFQML